MIDIYLVGILLDKLLEHEYLENCYKTHNTLMHDCSVFSIISMY